MSYPVIHSMNYLELYPFLRRLHIVRFAVSFTGWDGEAGVLCARFIS